MASKTTLAIVAIIAAVGLLGIVAVEGKEIQALALAATGQCASTEGKAFHNSSVALCHNAR